MTKLGEYLAQKAINKSEVARKTGLSKARISELSLKKSANLRANELYLIALTIDVRPCDMLNSLYGSLKLKSK